MRRTSDNRGVDRLWRTLAGWKAIGALLAAAGVAVLVAPTGAWASFSTGDWLEPLGREPQLRGVLALTAAGTVLLLARLLEHASGREGVDLAFGRIGRSRAAGWLAIGLGAAVTVAAWAVARDGPAPGEVVLPPGETAEAYASEVARTEMDAMLPRRVELKRLTTESGIRATLRLFKPGGVAEETYRVEPGVSVAVGGFRFAPVGLSEEKGRLVGLFGADDGSEATARAAAGGTFQLRSDGPTYRVQKIIRNYMKSQGMAAKLQAPDRGTFWVFERRPDGEAAPDLGHDVRLTGVEREPALVISVAPARPVWPYGLGGGLVALGIAGLLMAPRRAYSSGGRETTGESGRMGGA